MKYNVYKHIFPNNKVYIGITTKTNLKERWRGGSGYSHNNLMKKAIQKYGWGNIKHEILYEQLEEKEAKQKEIELIKKYNSTNNKYGYNLSNGGEGANGYKHTQEQIKRANQNKKKHIYTIEERNKISERNKKIWANENYKLKMKKIFENRKPKKHYKMSLEGKENIRKTRKIKYIKCIETGEVYSGTRDISKKLNIDRRTIMRILKKEYGFKSAKGLHFEYI